MKPEERKTKIAQLRKLVKAECRSLHVQSDRGTAHGWVTIWANDYLRFSKKEQAAMGRLGLSGCGNCHSIRPNELEGILQRLESTQKAPPAAAKPKPKPKPRPKGWRALRSADHRGRIFAIVDERDDLIADCYSNQEDALTMAASRELREACEEMLKVDNTQKRGTAMIKILAAVKLARRGAK